MKKNHISWAIPLAGVVLSGASASADQMQNVYLDSTNRITLSFRYGLNISARFNGIGSSFTSGSIYGNTQRTPNGDPYNYDNGYVLEDSTHDALGYTSYWGYNNSSQVNSLAPNTIAFNQTQATGIPSGMSDNGNTTPGVELTYDRQLGEIEDWHHLRYGVEGALNYMNISLNDSVSSTASLVTTTTGYSYQSGDTPPAAPFQGTPSGSGYMYLQVPPTYPTTPGPTTTTPGATFLAQDKFDGNLWGGRLGPYLELPLTEKLDLRLSGGLAVGLLYGNMSWHETLMLPADGGSISASGGGNSFDTLWGYYASLDATWQINNRWGVSGAVQLQDLGNYNHSFEGRAVDLDLSNTVFLELGISYSF